MYGQREHVAERFLGAAPSISPTRRMVDILPDPMVESTVVLAVQLVMDVLPADPMPGARYRAFAPNVKRVQARSPSLCESPVKQL